MFFRTVGVIVVVIAIGRGGSPTSPSGGDGNPAGQRTFYVAPAGDDAANGSASSPWLTFDHAVAQLRPGDTLYLRSGRYNQQIFEIKFAQGGTSWSNALTIASAPGELAVIETIGGDNAIRLVTWSSGIWSSTDPPPTRCRALSTSEARATTFGCVTWRSRMRWAAACWQAAGFTSS
jgi:hypothetical protein